MDLLFLAIGLVIGTAATWIAVRQRIAQNAKRVADAVESERRVAEAEKDALRQQIDSLSQQLERQRADEADRRREADRQWELKLEAVKKELLQTSAERLSASGEELRRSNVASIDRLMAPLKEQIEAFRRQMEDSSRTSAVGKKEMQDKFDSMMKLFAQQQEQAVKQLREETLRIGNDAVNLAKALKSDPKRRGNWGEMVLKTMLENSGLTEGEHFFLQQGVKSEQGDRFIPDVVVKFPEGRSVIIDSKVSLKAYAESFETDDEQQRAFLLGEHLASVERHVDELSRKNYPQMVENSLDYVLMFIPNESSYIEAIKLNPDLLRRAHDKHVIVVSPNNLMMALTLAYNMWQNDKQIKNVERIVERGKLLYEKVCNFQSSFDAIGDAIERLQGVYSKASTQLSTGSGNLLQQCEKLRSLGIKPSSGKRLKLAEPEAEPDDAVEK